MVHRRLLAVVFGVSLMLASCAGSDSAGTTTSTTLFTITTTTTTTLPPPDLILATDSSFVGLSGRYLDLLIEIGPFAMTNLDPSDYVTGVDGVPTDETVTVLDLTITNMAEGRTELPFTLIGILPVNGPRVPPKAALAIDGTPLPTTLEALTVNQARFVFPSSVNLAGSTVVIGDEARIPELIPLTPENQPGVAEPYRVGLALSGRAVNIGAPSPDADCNFMFDAELLSAAAVIDGLVENTPTRARVGERFLVFDLAVRNRPAGRRPEACVPMTAQNAQFRLIIDGFATSQLNAADIRAIPPGEAIVTRAYFAVPTGPSELDFVTTIGGRVGTWNIDLPLLPQEG